MDRVSLTAGPVLSSNKAGGEKYGDCCQRRSLVPILGTYPQLPSTAVDRGSELLPHVNSWAGPPSVQLACPRGAGVHVAAPCPGLSGRAGPAGQLAVRCQECRAADRSDTLSSLSTGWLGPFWNRSGAWAGAPAGIARGCQGLALLVVDT